MEALNKTKTVAMLVIALIGLVIYFGYKSSKQAAKATDDKTDTATPSAFTGRKAFQ